MPTNQPASVPGPSPLQQASPTTGPTAARGEEVFLTPGVLDFGTFDAAAAELTRLIRDADGRATDLRQTADHANALSTTLRTAMLELQDRLDKAGKATPMLERAIEGIVEGRRAEFEHSVAPTVETLRLLRREMDRIKSGIESTLSGAETRVASLEAKARAAVDAMNQRASEIERASAERFAAAEDRLRAVERRAAGLQHRMNSVVAQAEEAARCGVSNPGAQDAQALCVTIEAALEGSRRVEEITRLRLAELREVENLLGTLGGRVASLRAAAMQIPQIKPKGKRESNRDAA